MGREAFAQTDPVSVLRQLARAGLEASHTWGEV